MIKLLQTTKFKFVFLYIFWAKILIRYYVFSKSDLPFFSFEEVFNFNEIYFHTFIFIGHVFVSYPKYRSLHQVPKVFFHAHVEKFYSFRSQILFYGPFKFLLCYKGQNTFCCYYVKNYLFPLLSYLVTRLSLVNRTQSVYFQIVTYICLSWHQYITSWLTPRRLDFQEFFFYFQNIFWHLCRVICISLNFRINLLNPKTKGKNWFLSRMIMLALEIRIVILKTQSCLIHE